MLISGRAIPNRGRYALTFNFDLNCEVQTQVSISIKNFNEINCERTLGT